MVPRGLKLHGRMGTHHDLVRTVHELIADLRPDAPVASLAGLPHPSTPDLVDPLTPRELEVLRLVVAGWDNPAIASELVVAPRTVKKHINHIFSKLTVSHRGEAIARARELALVEEAPVNTPLIHPKLSKYNPGGMSPSDSAC